MLVTHYQGHTILYINISNMVTLYYIVTLVTLQHNETVVTQKLGNIITYGNISNTVTRKCTVTLVAK